MTPFGRVDLMIDTNIASYVLNGDPIAERYRPDLEDKVLGISFQAMAELLVGWRRQGWDDRAAMSAASSRYPTQWRFESCSCRFALIRSIGRNPTAVGESRPQMHGWRRRRCRLIDRW